MAANNSDRWTEEDYERPRQLVLVQVPPYEIAFKDHVAECVESAHHPGARQMFLRCNADAVALDLVGDGAVASSHGIIRVDYNLARKRFAVVFPDLRQGAVRYGDEYDQCRDNGAIAKLNGPRCAR